MTKKERRQRKLVRILETKGMLPVKALALMLGVSEMTVRRDLEELQYGPESTGESGPGGEYDLMQALEQANAQKNRIGAFAASLIQPGDVLVVDTGSTTARMLPHIPGDKDLTVLCYNANVLLELRDNPGIRLLFGGGVYHRNTEMFESPESIRFIQRTRANKVFLSAAGVHQELGLTCANEYEVPTKNAVMGSSSEKILLADSDKFGKVRSSYFCDLQEVDTIVTDKNLSSEWKGRIKEAGIHLHLV